MIVFLTVSNNNKTVENKVKDKAEMSGLTNRVKRGSRGSATLLEAANRILRLLGVSSTKRGKQPSPKTKVRSLTVCISCLFVPTRILCRVKSLWHGVLLLIDF